jgi:hypothetical protein
VATLAKISLVTRAVAAIYLALLSTVSGIGASLLCLFLFGLDYAAILMRGVTAPSWGS